MQVRIGPCDQENMEKDGLALLSNYQSLRILLELSHSPDLSEFSFWDKPAKGKVEGTEAWPKASRLARPAYKRRGRRDGSAVESICWSCRGPRFNFQNSCSSD